MDNLVDAIEDFTEKEAYPLSGHHFVRLRFYLNAFSGPKLLSVASRNVVEVLDTVTQCRMIDFRTNVKSDVTRFCDKCGIEEFCWIIKFSHRLFYDQLTWLHNKFL